MTRVQTILLGGARTGETAGTVFLHGGGGDDVGIARLRGPADIATEFPSGSDRVVVGPAVRFAKRAVRRGLRWYVGPMIEQQSQFNHLLLDVMERLRLQNERLTGEIEKLQTQREESTGASGPTADD